MSPVNPPAEPEKPLTLIERNPLAVRAGVTAAVVAVIHLAVTLGAPIPDGTDQAVAGAVDAVGLVVLLLWARPAVTPNAKVISRVTTAGEVVTGEAAALPVGTELASDVRPPVKPELVVDQSHAMSDGEYLEPDVSPDDPRLS